MMPQKVEWCFVLHVRKVLVVILCLCIGGQCQQCGFESYPEFVDISLNNQLFETAIGHPGQFLLNGVEFSCDGYIQHWELYCLHNGSHPIEFQVWHRNTSTSLPVYNLVGKNFFQDSRPDINNLVSHRVPLDQQIRVQPGDIVGVRTFTGTISEVLDYQIQAHVTIGTIHETLTILTYSDFFQESNDPTPSVVNLNGDGVFTFSFGLAPVMRIAIVDTLGSTTSALSSDSSTGFSTEFLNSLPTVQSSPFPQAAVIAIAASASAVGIILFLTVVGLIVCCCVFQSRHDDTRSTKMSNTSNDQNTRAEADNTHSIDSELEMQRNVAYSSGSGVSNSNHTDRELEMLYNSVYATSITNSSGPDSNNYSWMEEYTPQEMQRENAGSVYYSKIPEGGKLPVREEEAEYTEMN